MLPPPRSPQKTRSLSLRRFLPLFWVGVFFAMISVCCGGQKLVVGYRTVVAVGQIRNTLDKSLKAICTARHLECAKDPKTYATCIQTCRTVLRTWVEDVYPDVQKALEATYEILDKLDNNSSDISWIKAITPASCKLIDLIDEHKALLSTSIGQLLTSSVYKLARSLCK